MSPRLARSWAVPAIAGAVAVVLLAMASVRAPGAGLAPYAGSALPVSPGSPVAWAFATERLGLAGVRLWLAEPPPPGATLNLTLFPADNLSSALAGAAVPLAEAGPDGAVEAQFAPLWVRDTPHTPAATLVARLQVDGPSGARVVLQGSGDSSGPAFTPIYQVRPFDRLWPITEMAYGRTGLLGMPSFYALLAYAFLVALLRMVLLAVRAASAR